MYVGMSSRRPTLMDCVQTCFAEIRVGIVVLVFLPIFLSCFIISVHVQEDLHAYCLGRKELRTWTCARHE